MATTTVDQVAWSRRRRAARISASATLSSSSACRGRGHIKPEIPATDCLRRPAVSEKAVFPGSPRREGSWERGPERGEQSAQHFREQRPDSKRKFRPAMTSTRYRDPISCRQDAHSQNVTAITQGYFGAGDTDPSGDSRRPAWGRHPAARRSSRMKPLQRVARRRRARRRAAGRSMPGDPGGGVRRPGLGEHCTVAEAHAASDGLAGAPDDQGDTEHGSRTPSSRTRHVTPERGTYSTP